MLIPRVIPCLQLFDGAMVKTRKFGKRIYLGDPVNVISLFNRFEVDEIVLLDIGATRNGTPPDFNLIARLAEECWVPLTYGGGVTTLQQIEQVILAGVEKIVLHSAIGDDLSLATRASGEFGTQAIVGSIDAKKKFLGGYDVRIKHGERSLGLSPADRAKQLEDAGAGEILLQSIDRDGEMSGYDLDLIRSVTEATLLPVVACSGAGVRSHLAQPIREAGASATAAGSLFVFSGEARGVVINFPERAELERLISGNDAAK